MFLVLIAGMISAVATLHVKNSQAESQLRGARP
jgi:hypothetical protein